MNLKKKVLQSGNIPRRRFHNRPNHRRYQPERQITFAVSALKDRKDKQAYYASEGSPDVTSSLTTEIIERVGKGRRHPTRGRVVTKFFVEICRKTFHDLC